MHDSFFENSTLDLASDSVTLTGRGSWFAATAQFKQTRYPNCQPTIGPSMAPDFI